MFPRSLCLFRGSLILVPVLLFSPFPARPAAVAQQADATSITLVNTIETSQWHRPSPDPSGITYWPRHETLMVSDGEVDETGHFDPEEMTNVFEATLTGDLVRTHTTMGFSREPVGIDIAVNPDNDHFFITDDNKELVFEVNPGPDKKIGNGSDDQVSSFSTSAFGNNDPEGIAYGQGKLFIVDGAGSDVYIVDPGPNGTFGDADDSVSHFDVGVMGQQDPEGIDYNSETGTLFLVSRKSNSPITEVTVDGRFLRNIDISSLSAVGPSDLTFAPASDSSGALHLYITDRGVDNNVDPNENDGKIYEIALDGAEPSQPPAAPTGLSASAGDGEVSLSWNASSGAGSYNVKRSSSSGGPYNLVANTTNSSFTDIGLTNDTTYFYVVSALNSAGESADSVEVSATPSAAPPPPANLLENHSFELDEDGNNRPDSWSSNSNFTRSSTVAARSGSYVGRHFSTKNAGYSVNQRVDVREGGGYSFSGWVNVPPTSDAFSFKPQVVWRNAGNSTISVETVATYEAATGGWTQFNGTLTAPSGAVRAVVRMRVSSLNATIYVDDLLFASADDAPSAPPAAPTGLSASAGDGQVSLSWAASSGAGSYNVKRSSTSGGPYNLVANTTNSSFTDTGLTNGTTYFYVVSALNSAGESADSVEVSATPSAAPPPPANLLENPGFELDEDGDNSPDVWSTSANFTRSDAVAPYSGSFAGRHLSTSDATYGITQKVAVSAGTTYSFSGWVNVPPTSDAFSFKLRVAWRDSAGSTLAVDSIADYEAATGGWTQFSSTPTAPAGAVEAVVRMRVVSLNASIYVDNLLFTSADDAPPAAPTGLSASAGDGQVSLS